MPNPAFERDCRKARQPLNFTLGVSVPPKIRNPFVSWLLTVFTGGTYLIFWAWLIANELNTAEKRAVFKIDIWRRTFFILTFAALVGFVVVKTNNPIFFLVVFLCMFSLFIYVQFAIGNYIKSKDIELNTGKTYSNAMSVILLWFVANLGVAYMQASINRIIRLERERS
jgi:hypothetical protein